MTIIQLFSVEKRHTMAKAVLNPERAGVPYTEQTTYTGNGGVPYKE